VYSTRRYTGAGSTVAITEESNQGLTSSLRSRSCIIDGEVVCHACKLGLEGIVSKRLGSPYRSGRSRHWVKSKNPAAPAVKREAEEDWS
jgi:hypothetical protein